MGATQNSLLIFNYAASKTNAHSDHDTAT